MRMHIWWLTIMMVYEDHFWSKCTQAKPKTQQFSASQLFKFMSRKHSQPRVELFLELNWGSRSMAENLLFKNPHSISFSFPNKYPKNQNCKWTINVCYQIICIHDSTSLLSHSTKLFFWQTYMLTTIPCFLFHHLRQPKGSWGCHLTNFKRSGLKTARKIISLLGT